MGDAPKEVEPTESQAGVPQFAAKQITVRTRARIDTVQVLEHELDDLAAAYAQTNQDLNFAIGLGGVGLAFLMGILTGWNTLAPRLIFPFAAGTISCAIGSLWFLIRWLRLRKRGPELLARIKSRRPEVTLTEIQREQATEGDQPSAEK